MRGYVVLIAEGKTFRVTGGAGIFFFFQNPNTDYIKQRRPNPKNDQMITVGDIKAMLQRSWQEFGLEQNKDVGPISCCLIRKKLVSKVRPHLLDQDTVYKIMR